ncbi:histidine kinase [Rhizobium sp. Root149]|uniref:response regulator n=1 Tax=Rhizobium sp. Root149 TaxID=1736473 RepID=UPI0007156CA7|nr:response regulator [Rhizobium sp. Root149]KQZ62180.1 histidine kinase [Rhizobium sp. Root149]
MTHKTVLLVEDEMFVALDIQMTLEDEGWEVSGPFATTREALEFLEANVVDCAILDVRLTDGEVFPVADLLTESGIPFVFHSGHANPAKLQQEYLQALVCQKPCHPTALVERLISSRVKGRAA